MYPAISATPQLRSFRSLADIRTPPVDSEGLTLCKVAGGALQTLSKKVRYLSVHFPDDDRISLNFFPCRSRRRKGKSTPCRWSSSGIGRYPVRFNTLMPSSRISYEAAEVPIGPTLATVDSIGIVALTNTSIEEYSQMELLFCLGGCQSFLWAEYPCWCRLMSFVDLVGIGLDVDLSMRDLLTSE